MTVTESRTRTELPEAPTIPSERMRALRSGRRALGTLAIVLPPLLVGYALFDKGFAYLHIPGIPIFAGEVVMLMCLAAAIVGTGFLHRGLKHSTVAKLLVVFGAWGLVRTLPHLQSEGLYAVRDSALWYYSLLAIPICALVLCDPELLRRWTSGYRRLIPWILVTSPFAIALNAAADKFHPLVPDSTVTLNNHKPGNIAVHVTMALAFLWLVPEAGGRFRAALTGLGTVVLLIVATQNRGGFVAAAAGLAVAWLFGKRRGRMALVMVATVLAIVVAGWGLNIQFRGEQNRRISVDQLIQNVGSLTGGANPQAAGNLDSNVEFRDQLWRAVLVKVKKEKKVLIGLGFGPSIAAQLGFQGEATPELRSPHNSHLDVLARMGVIGAVMWAALWSSWYWIALRTRIRLRRVGRAFEASLMEVAVVGVTAILINAYFDPTIESPQVALWLWTIVGLSLGIVAISGRATAQPAPQRRDNALPQLPG